MTDLRIFAGNTHVIESSVADGAGVPVSLMGATVAFRAGPSPRMDTITIEKVSPHDDIVVTDEAGGVVRVTLTAEETAPLRHRIWWEIDVVEAGGRTSTVSSGYIYIDPTLLSQGAS